MANANGAPKNTVFYISTQDKELQSVHFPEQATDSDIIPSPKRFLQLFIFSLGTFVSALFFAEYVIISDVVVSFYGVSSFAVTSTATVFLVGFALPLIPIIMLVDKKGLRFVFNLGVGLITIGAWIRCAGLGPDYFWTLMVSHVIISLTQCCFLPITTLFAATWFGPDEVSKACSVGIFSNIFGVALSCLIPPLLVTGKTPEEIKIQLLYLHTSFAVVSSVVLVLGLVGLRDQPSSPPSLSQKLIRDSKKTTTGGSGILETMAKLVKNTNCMLEIVASAINFGVMNTITSIMNEMILSYYPNANKDVGILGLLILLIGIPTSLMCGSLLDNTRKYKTMFVFTSIGSCLGLVGFMGSLFYSMPLIYVSVVILGFFLNGYLTVSLEFGAEISYPLPEFASSGLILAIGGLYGVGLTYLSSWVLKSSGVISANLVILFSLVIETALGVFVKSDLKRQQANFPERNF